MSNNDRQFQHLDPTNRSFPTTINTYWDAYDECRLYRGKVLVSNGYINDVSLCLPEWMIGQHIATLERDVHWVFNNMSASMG